MKQLHDLAETTVTRTVLLVESDALVRFVTADLLRSLEFIVLEAAHAEEALWLLSAGKQIDVVLADVKVPDEPSDLELAQTVTEHFPHIPVVLTSAHQKPDAFKAPFLLKPYRDDDVVALLRTVVEARSGTGEEDGWHEHRDGGGRGSPGPE